MGNRACASFEVVVEIELRGRTQNQSWFLVKKTSPEFNTIMASAIFSQ
jgi:hypothetical protein